MCTVVRAFGIAICALGIAICALGIAICALGIAIRALDKVVHSLGIVICALDIAICALGKRVYAALTQRRRGDVVEPVTCRGVYSGLKRLSVVDHIDAC